jgi:hypothetical protein
MIEVLLRTLHHTRKAIEKLSDFSFLLGRLDAVAIVGFFPL